MFFEKYIKDPLQYAWSDPKKIFVGGVLHLISMFGISVGVMVMFASAIPVLMNIAPEIALFASLGGVLFGFIIATIGVVVYAFIGGYCVKLIENTLQGSSELPEWENFKELLKKGAYFLTGLFIIYAVFTLITTILIIPFYLPLWLTMWSESFSNMLIIGALINLISCGMAIVQTLYMELAPINFVDKNDFKGFFEVKEIISKMSIEYVLVLVAISIVTILITMIVCILLLIPVLIGTVTNNVLLMASISIIVLAMPFLCMFFTVFWYRSITNYYLSKKESMLEEKTDLENNE
ncbi:DUF4013 domain-containing protein [Methanococcus maripaludis]|uniref:MFS family permease n=2 Tax=Methanococcus maripaludis TaxID=39152 RepID=A0A7J9PE97_METMI|nr:DUF4013 domain-containing protein [Methanococcus maripaludis]MBA2861575.1 MFS family permease [Methanococcus maripaludis]